MISKLIRVLLTLGVIAVAASAIMESHTLHSLVPEQYNPIEMVKTQLKPSPKVTTQPQEAPQLIIDTMEQDTTAIVKEENKIEI